MKRRTILKGLVLSLVLYIGLEVTAKAMHIMEGYLPLSHCIVWAIISIPFVIKGVKNINKISNENRKLIMILAMAGAYAFILSALKIPSVSGSSSHPTGTGLVAILFGPAVASLIGLIVLIFQALLLAHGGISTLGANTFSMGIAGPLLSYLIYRPFKKSGKHKSLGVFLAASLGNLLTYVVTSFQLALAHPSEIGGVLASFSKFAGIFALTQVPLAIIEGILTVIVIMGLENLASSEMGMLKKLEGF